MLPSNLFARVFLMFNGNIYIAVDNGSIIVCSASSLFMLCSDPFSLSKEIGKEFREVSWMVNPRKLPMAQIPGLTLAWVTADGSFHCEYAVLMRSMRDSLIPSKRFEPLKLHFPKELSVIEDEKHFCLQAFSLLSGMFPQKPQFQNRIVLSDEFRDDFMSEVTRSIGLFFGNEEVEEQSPVREFVDELLLTEKANTTVPESTEPEEPPMTDTTAKKSKEIPKDYLSVRDFAKHHNVALTTVHSWIYLGKIKPEQYIQDYNKEIFIDPTTPRPVDGRKGRRTRKGVESRRSKYSSKMASYDDTQWRIREDHIVTNAIRPFISNYGEALYYKRHAYHEVVLNGKPALIIDINPEYFCKRLGKTNRELIEAGKSPVVPTDDQHCYHLHHIGQRKKSPLAIIPETDHNSEKYYSLFHSNSDCEEGIHGKDFEAEKRAFWKAFLELYDAHGQNYRKIPYMNPRNRTPKSLK